MSRCELARAYRE